MKETLNILKNEDGGLSYVWKIGRIAHTLNSNWNYRCKGVEVNLLEEIKKLNLEETRINKKFNIFRKDNQHYFYSDGNSDAWVIVSNFILEVLSKFTGKDYRLKFLKGNRISIVNTNKELLPSNILVGNKLLSDIIKFIFEVDGSELSSYAFLLEYCNDSTELDSLFKESEYDQVTMLFNMYNELSTTEQKMLLEKIINNSIKCA